MRVLNKLQQPGFELADVFDSDVVCVTVGRGPDPQHLFLDVHRLILRLFQNLCQPLSASELCLRRLVEVRTELTQTLQLAELGQVETKRSRPASWL